MLYLICISKPVPMARLALIIIFTFAAPIFAVGQTPLTEEQLIEMSKTTLREYPKEVINLVKERGVNFFPTKTILGWLENEGVHPSVLPEIKRMAAEQLRIKICQFSSDDSSLGQKLTQQVIRDLYNAKRNYVESVGIIPLDDRPCSQEGFDSNVKPEPNTFYILLKAWIRGTSSGYSLSLQVIFRDLSGKQHPLPHAPNQPASLTKNTVDKTAAEIINWVLATTRQYAET